MADIIQTAAKWAAHLARASVLDEEQLLDRILEAFEDGGDVIPSRDLEDSVPYSGETAADKTIVDGR